MLSDGSDESRGVLCFIGDEGGFGPAGSINKIFYQ